MICLLLQPPCLLVAHQEEEVAEVALVSLLFILDGSYPVMHSGPHYDPPAPSYPSAAPSYPSVAPSHAPAPPPAAPIYPPVAPSSDSHPESLYPRPTVKQGDPLYPGGGIAMNPSA